VENQNYFEMLGVARDAGQEDIRTKFFDLAKEWHPDRIKDDVEALKPYVHIIFGYITEAHECLANEETRVAYLQTVREGGGTPATDRLMESILDSALKYERVLVLSRQHQYETALAELKEILASTKDEPDYHAMLAWLMLKTFPKENAPYNEMLESLDRALDLYENHEKANLYKAQVLRNMGRPREALKHFKKVVEVNPKNVEAAREVRVANMRGVGSSSEADEEAGLLSGLQGLGKKFFKKK
jgi:curved DNA-binding protein CbpA